MIELPSLREYQLEFVDSLRNDMRRTPRTIGCMPTGAGKSTVAKYLFGLARNKPPTDKQSGFSLFAVHRRGLVDNIVDTFNRSPALPHGMIMSGRDTNWNEPVQVASIDTLLSWHLGDGYEANVTFDLVSFDETHSHFTKLAKWLKFHDQKRLELGLNPAFVIGLTATPQAKGLASVYGGITKGPSVQWLIDNGYLVPFRYYQAKHVGRLDQLVKSGTTFTAKSLESAFDGMAGNLVDDWKARGEDRQTVGFFSRLSHAREAQHKLNEAGIKAEYVDGNTSDEERRQLFRGLQDGDYKYLCNVGIVDRGTDIPAIGCIQLCTAINSITRLIQILGRGARPHEGKEDCVLIDHGSSVTRLNTFFEDDIEWVLAAEKEKDLEHEGRPVILCPQCSRQYRGGRCASCGYEPTPSERKQQGLEWAEGKLVEIKKKPTKDGRKLTCEEIFVNALYQAGRSGRTWKQAIGIAYRVAEKQGTKFRVPSKVKVGGTVIKSLPYGHSDGTRKVEVLFNGKFSRR
jgi:superfamily II DNA or RNA helicase